ncbi:MAG: PE family protein [Mycobacterium sp.]
MAFVFATPEALAAAASDVAGIGSALGEASAAAAGPTTAVVAAAEDGVSAQIAVLLSGHGLGFQQVSAQLSTFHDQFVQALASGAGAYSAAETTAVRALTNAVAAPAAAVSDASNGLASAAASAAAKVEGALSGGGLGLLGGSGLLERAAQEVSQEFGALRQAGALLLTPTGGIRAWASATGLLSPAAATAAASLTPAANALASIGNSIEAAYLALEPYVQYGFELVAWAAGYVIGPFAQQINIFYNLIEPLVQSALFNVIDTIDQTITVTQGLANFSAATNAAINQFVVAEAYWVRSFLPPAPPNFP